MFDTNITLNQFVEAIGDTFYMVGMSLLLGTIIGTIFGITFSVQQSLGIMYYM